ncbi:MAG: hypothetical protein M4579_006099 [Chaenotheca gracillima]|nr:MAG: hypothetical protein M4579_006099 [Chaenotheca gracillima]
MDPFSADSELLNMQNAFYQGQYQQVIEFDTTSFSEANALPARVLGLRAQLALGKTDDVIADVEGEDSVPELAAVKALAQHLAGSQSAALKAVEELVSSASENATVQTMGATVLQAEGKSEEALALLAKHQGNLEAVALIVQIQLQQNRTDLALKEVQAAKRWAQDSLLVNIAESWVGLRLGGDKYQDAFYVFEELASAPATTAVQSLVSQAVAELHLGRIAEAEAALQQAIERDPKDTNVIANTIVLSVIAGKDPQESVSSLQSTAPDHPLLVDLQEKSALFDKAAGKYSATVSA